MRSLSRWTGAALNSTPCSPSHIRHDINTEDKFYDAEVEYADAVLPELEEYVDRWNRSLVGSKRRPQLEEKYCSIAFLNKEIDMRTFSPEIVPELQKKTRSARNIQSS